MHNEFRQINQLTSMIATSTQEKVGNPNGEIFMTYILFYLEDFESKPDSQIEEKVKKIK